MAAYEIVKVEGSGMSMSDMRIRPTVHFEIKHIESGDKAWSGTSYFTSSGARTIAGLRLAASKMIKRYEYHLEKTGKRFEVTEREEKAAKWLAKKTEQRLAYLRRTIPLLQGELASAEAGVPFNLKADKFTVEKTEA